MRINLPFSYWLDVKLKSTGDFARLLYDSYQLCEEGKTVKAIKKYRKAMSVLGGDTSLKHATETMRKHANATGAEWLGGKKNESD